MNPRVSISPLRSDDVRPSKKSDRGRTPGRVRRSDKAKLSGRDRLSSGGYEKSRSWSDSDDGGDSGKLSEKDDWDVPSARRRSRNIQLTSLFDSLSRFFSADSDRRRRTAYVNATVSLAQSSLNPRHSFTGLQPPVQVAPPPVQVAPQPTNQKASPQATARLTNKKASAHAMPPPTNQKASPRLTNQKASPHVALWPTNQSTPPQATPRPTNQKPPLKAMPKPTNQKARKTSSKPTNQKARQHVTPHPTTENVRQLPAKQLPPKTTDKTAMKPHGRRGRTKSWKTVKRPAAAVESPRVKDDVMKTLTLRPADGEEMKDLMTTSVDESETKLFHTAQTIAQQVLNLCKMCFFVL